MTKLPVIENPCEMKWDDLEPRGEGRWCASCDRTVVDLSRLTRRAAIARVERATDRLCLAIRYDARTHAPVFRAEARWPRNAVVAGGLALAACGTPAAAETPVVEVEAPAEASMSPAEIGEPMQPVGETEAPSPELAMLTRAVPASELDLGPDSGTPTAAQRTLTAQKQASLHPAPPPHQTYMMLGF